MKRFIRENAGNRNIIILLILVLLFQQVLFTHLLPKGEHAVMLDTLLFYSAEDAYEIIGNYSPEMRRGFIIGELTLDLIFPLIYAMLFSFLLARLFGGKKIILFPFLMLIFDYLENAAIVIMLLSYPQKFLALGTMAAVFSAIKWMLLPVIILLLLIGVIIKIRQYLLKRKSSF
jgi:hypothetical protein